MHKIDPVDLDKFYSLLNGSGRKALTVANPDKDGLHRLFSRGNEWLDYMAIGIAQFTAKMPDYGLAKSILGADFITPKEITEARPSIVYTDDETYKLAESLPPQDVLMWCKDNGYAVMPAPPRAMSTSDVREIQPAHFYLKTGGWYADQKFAHEDKTSQGWLAIKKIPVSNSTSKNWNEQNKLLSSVERVPNAALMSWFITTYFEVRGERLFESVYVRTSSLDLDGSRISVGRFDAEGLDVDGYWDDSCYGDMGVSACRKF